MARLVRVGATALENDVNLLAPLSLIISLSFFTCLIDFHIVEMLEHIQHWFFKFDMRGSPGVSCVASLLQQLLPLLQVTGRTLHAVPSRKGCSSEEFPTRDGCRSWQYTFRTHRGSQKMIEPYTWKKRHEGVLQRGHGTTTLVSIPDTSGAPTGGEACLGLRPRKFGNPRILRGPIYTFTHYISLREYILIHYYIIQCKKRCREDRSCCQNERNTKAVIVSTFSHALSTKNLLFSLQQVIDDFHFSHTGIPVIDLVSNSIPDLMHPVASSQLH